MDLIDEVRADDMLDLARDLYCSERLNLVLIGPYQNEDRFRALLTL
jgi:hypothetical protein